MLWMEGSTMGGSSVFSMPGMTDLKMIEEEEAGEVVEAVVEIEIGTGEGIEIEGAVAGLVDIGTEIDLAAVVEETRAMIEGDVTGVTQEKSTAGDVVIALRDLRIRGIELKSFIEKYNCKS